MLTVNGSDITKAVIAAEISEKINSGAAVLSFSVLKSEAQKLKNGDEAVLLKDGHTVFIGKIFSRKINRDIAEISAFDSIANLKAVLPVKRNAGKVSKFIGEIFALASPYVRAGIIDECSAELVPNQYKNISLLNIIYKAIDEAGTAKGRFVLRDEGGTVAFRNEELLTNGYILNAKSVIDFDYSHSAEDCLNYVKLISNNVENAYTDTVVVKNELSIGKLGVRGITKKVYEKNPEQLAAMAKQLLLEKNKEKEQLVVTAIGDASVRAGCRIWCDLNGVGTFWARVVSSKHSFEGKSYFMRLELERI